LKCGHDILPEQIVALSMEGNQPCGVHWKQQREPEVRLPLLNDREQMSIAFSWLVEEPRDVT
jgi:hypothetical protein